jgi:hypothetical protein
MRRSRFGAPPRRPILVGSAYVLSQLARYELRVWEQLYRSRGLLTLWRKSISRMSPKLRSRNWRQLRSSVRAPSPPRCLFR